MGPDSGLACGTSAHVRRQNVLTVADENVFAHEVSPQDFCDVGPSSRVTGVDGSITWQRQIRRMGKISRTLTWNHKAKVGRLLIFQTNNLTIYLAWVWWRRPWDSKYFRFSATFAAFLAWIRNARSWSPNTIETGLDARPSAASVSSCRTYSSSGRTPFSGSRRTRQPCSSCWVSRSQIWSGGCWTTPSWSRGRNSPLELYWPRRSILPRPRVWSR